MDKVASRDINRELIGNGTCQNFIPTILSESTEDDLDYSCGRIYRTPVDSVLLNKCCEELLTFLKVTLKVIQGVAPVLLL